MTQNYIVDKLTLSDLTTSGKVIIPSYQRGLVWTKQHRKDFIETVKSGDPFGVVLVYQESINAPYFLIDGLQRLSTLKAYMTNPLEFIDENDKFIDKTKLRALTVAKYKSLGLSLPNDSRLDKEEKTFLKKLITVLKSYDEIPSSVQVWEDASSILAVDMNSFPLMKSFSAFYDDFLVKLQLPDVIIHAIVYQGEKDRLPSVFETLNTTSVQLTKYEIFSSTWPTTKYLVNDPELIDRVWSKYEGLAKSSTFDVDVDKARLESEGITLFEYCFGFSELVCDPDKEYAFLFNKGKKTTDPTGFELLALACGLLVNKADDLWKDDRLGKSNMKFLVDLKEALIDAVKLVSKTLKPWVFDLKNSSIKIDSAYQVYYMIISLFFHLYKVNLKEKRIEKNEEETEWVEGFKKNAFKWFLYHQIIDFWSQHRQVKDLSDLLASSSTNGMYYRSISYDEWEQQILTFSSNLKDSAITRTIDSESKLFLNYYYRLLIKEDRNREKYFLAKADVDEKPISFDIEHIVPVEKFDSFEEELPISAIGNLCYLAVKDNRSKGSLTIYEYADNRPALTYDNSFLSLIDYPSKQDLSFVNSPIEQFRPAYLNLINKREDAIRERFCMLITSLT